MKRSKLMVNFKAAVDSCKTQDDIGGVINSYIEAKRITPVNCGDIVFGNTHNDHVVEREVIACVLADDDPLDQDEILPIFLVDKKTNQMIIPDNDQYQADISFFFMIHDAVFNDFWESMIKGIKKSSPNNEEELLEKMKSRVHNYLLQAVNAAVAAYNNGKSFYE